MKYIFAVLVFMGFGFEASASYELYPRDQKKSSSATVLDSKDKLELKKLRNELLIDEKKDEAMVQAVSGMSETLLKKDRFDRLSASRLGNKEVANVVVLLDKTFDDRWNIYRNMYLSLKAEKNGALAVPFGKQLEENSKSILGYMAKYKQLTNQKDVDALASPQALDQEVKAIMDDFVDLGAACNNVRDATRQSNWCSTQ